jgi:uncharacterized protein
MLHTLFLIVLGISIGLLMGIIGGGGGGLYIIVMMFVLKLNISHAVGMALMLSTVTLLSATWQYGKKKQIKLDYFVIISVSGILGVLLGSTISKNINETLLKYAIIVVFVFSGISSLFKIKSPNSQNTELPKAVTKLHILIPMGLIGGFITGSLGLSGAVPMTSFMIGLLNFQPLTAIGTTMAIALALNSTGAVFHLATQSIDWSILLIFGLGSIIGATFGVKIAAKINKKVLTAILATLTIGSGIYLAIHG